MTKSVSTQLDRELWGYARMQLLQKVKRKTVLRTNRQALSAVSATAMTPLVLSVLHNCGLWREARQRVPLPKHWLRQRSLLLSTGNIFLTV